MRTIYRMESLGGKGPYYSKNRAVADIVLSHEDSEDHPTPYGDDRVTEGLGWDHDSWATGHLSKAEGKRLKHGFDSIRSLRKWFSSEELLALSKNGFMVVSYRVPDNHVFRYAKQCVFVRPLIKTRKIVGHESKNK